MRTERDRYLSGLKEIGRYKESGGNGIKANTPVIAELAQTVNRDQWYDLIDVAGEGKMFYLAVCFNDLSNDRIQIRITIDGGTANSLIGATGYSGILRTNIAKNNEADASLSKVISSNIDFKTSLKVEVKYINVASDPATATVNAYASLGVVS